MWRLPRLLVGCAVALLGCVTAQALLPAFPVPPVLEQLYEARTPPRHWPVLEARVSDVRTLPEQRLRISLTDLHLQQPDGQPLVHLPGNLAWTWEQAAVFPLPGQTVRLQRKLLPVDTQRNFGLTDWGFWWHSHGTGWRIWSRGTGGQPAVDGAPSPFARQRLELIRKFLAVLLPGRDDLLPPAAASPSGLSAIAPPQPPAAAPSTPSAAPVPQGKAILLALLFGERFLLETPTVKAFNAGNLSHSLALSGQHLLVAGLAGMLLVWLAARMHPGLYLWRPRTVLIPLAACPAALAYLWLGNAPPSLLRAAGMLLLLATAMAMAHLRCMPLPQTLRERLPSSGLDVLCCTLLCITVISPLSVFDTGLQLSALCVSVICCATPLMGQLLRRIPRTSPGQRLLRSLASILLVSFFIQLALLPLSLLLFNNSGLWFLLNVFWLPVLGTLVLPGAFLGLGLSLCGLGPAAALVLDVVALPCQWMVDGLLFLQTQGWLSIPPILRPHWTALPAMACLFLALALRAGRPALPPAGKRLLICGLLLACAGPALRLHHGLVPQVELSVPDVGQAQAVLLRLPHGFAAHPLDKKGLRQADKFLEPLLLRLGEQHGLVGREQSIPRFSVHCAGHGQPDELLVGGHCLAGLRAEHAVELSCLPARQRIVKFTDDGKKILQKLYARAAHALGQPFGILAGDLTEGQSLAVELAQALDIIINERDAVPCCLADKAVLGEVELPLERPHGAFGVRAEHAVRGIYLRDVRKIGRNAVESGLDSADILGKVAQP